MAKYTLSVTWNGAQSAQLFYVLDDGAPVPLAGKPTTGTGSITISFLGNDLSAHKFAFGLTFPGKTLKNLVAKMSKGNGTAVDLGVKDSASQLWVGSKVVSL